MRPARMPVLAIPAPVTIGLAVALTVGLAAQTGKITFPDGEGKAMFLEACGGCHDLSAVVVKRHTPREWEDVMVSMKAKGITTADEDLEAITAYLSRRFGLVDVNTAGADELTRVLGITAHDARAIVAHRDRQGAYTSLDALKAVPGIDTQALETAKASLVFGGT